MPRLSFTLIVLIAGLSFAFVPPFFGEFTPVVFEMEGKGTIRHYHPGFKPFKTKANAVSIPACIQGNALFGCWDPGDVAGDGGDSQSNINKHLDGKAYLFYDGITSWRIGTDPTGTDAVELRGMVTPDGKFFFTGALEDGLFHSTQMVLKGKVAFRKDGVTPKDIKGSLEAVSSSQEHLGQGKFRVLELYVPPIPPTN